MSEISKESWEAWLDLPETKALRALAASRRKEIKDRWERGGFVESEMANAVAIGGCKALQLLEDLDYDLVVGEELEGAGT